MTDDAGAGPVVEEQQGVGTPDALQRLWTPHRMAYISGDAKPADGECPFCRIPGLPDDEGLIVARGDQVFAVLNLYPYNAGHVLVVPYRHVADYTELDDDETAELAAMTKSVLLAVRGTSGPQGFNVGLNLGTAAGAGIAPHLHQHVVPRWGGDSNFMPVIGQTKVLPQLLHQTRELLVQSWQRLELVGKTELG
ncbi:HIT domain-containing protein [Acidothermaceae bacterium B102]|nr:HIT domain-containing protein [Acidothermaceae bacterium B102]